MNNVEVTTQKYIDALKIIRQGLVSKTMPQIASNHSAVMITSGWIDNLNNDIDLIESLLEYIKKRLTK